MRIEERIKDVDTKGVSNKSHVIGEITDLLGEGIHRGEEYYLVLVRAIKVEGRRNYVSVILPKEEEYKNLIDKKAIIYAEGAVVSSFNFNDNEVKHIYINPYKIEEVKEEFKVERENEFYVNYTLCNRVVLKGVVDNKSTVKYIESMGMNLTKFRLKSKSGATFNCTLWDTVKSIEDITEGLPVEIVGSMSVLTKDIVNRHRRKEARVESNEDRTTYNILVQKISIDK